MGVIIQKIKTNWTKASRGEPRASLRNKTPDKFDFPELSNIEKHYIQEIAFFEHDNFSKPYLKRPRHVNDIQLSEIGLELTFQENKVEITSWIDSRKAKKVGVLNYNNWAQIITNRRIVYEDTWGYYKQVINLFYGEASKASDLTCSRKPQIRFDDRNLLSY